MSAPLLIVAEDARAAAFHPLSDTRPVFELRAGILSNRERLQRSFPQRTPVAVVRPELAENFAAVAQVPCGWAAFAVADDVLLVNGRILAGAEWAREATRLRPGQTLRTAGKLAAARLDASGLEACRAAGEPWPEEVLAGLECAGDVGGGGGEWLEHPWDLVARNPEWLARDAEALGGLGEHRGEIEPGVHLREPGRIRLGTGSRVEAGCYLDASAGPIVLGENVWVRSHTRIEGPMWAGADCQLLGGRIGEGTSLGPESRVGGEIEETVVQGYSNKRHEGFVGHSYIGEWVNLGALTTTSDLKNNYGSIRMWERGEMRDTGLLKLGSLVGDHSKTAIGTLLGTGTVVGVMSNVFRVSPPKRVPSFRWLGEETEEPFRWDKARVLLATSMGRRGVTPPPEYCRLFERLAREAGAV